MITLISFHKPSPPPVMLALSRYLKEFALMSSHDYTEYFQRLSVQALVEKLFFTDLSDCTPCGLHGPALVLIIG